MKNNLFLLAGILCVLFTSTLNAQSISITSPGNDTSYKVVDEVTFEWTYSGEITTLELLLSVDEGSSYQVVSAPFSADDESYVYSIPVEADAGEYLFKLKDANGATESTPVNLFLEESVKISIDKTDYITLEDIVFTWVCTPGITTLDVRMSTDGGSTFGDVITGESVDASLGTYNLTIPASAPSGDYYMIMANEDNSVQSNVVMPSLTDSHFAGVYAINPEDMSSVTSDLSNLTNSGILAVEFEESIEIIGGKTIHLRSDDTDPATDLTFSTDNSSVVYTDSEDERTLYIDASAYLPLETGATYYVDMGADVVIDLAGNAFVGFTDDWTFTVNDSYTLSGNITYDGSSAETLYILLFSLEDWMAGDFSNPVGSIILPDPSYPDVYNLTDLVNGSYVLLSFIDVNGDGQLDEENEPMYANGEILIAGDDLTGVDIYMEDQINIVDDFTLDVPASEFYNPDEDYTGYFTALGDGNYVVPTLNGLTAATMNSFLMAENLYGMGFWIKENEGEANNLEDELAGSYLDAGTSLHLEYTYATDKEINFVAAGSIINACSIVKGAEENRLIIDMVIVDPVHSATGDFGASCGLTISCDPVHTGGVSAYGSVFYGDLYSHDMGMTLTASSDRIGMRVNGEAGYEAHLTGLLSDAFLINVLGFDENDMPTTSADLGGLIPDLGNGDYTVDNTFNAITEGFDMDGDGSDNDIYKVTINNSSWSEHDLLFGMKNISTEMNKAGKENLISLFSDYIQVNDAVNSITVYDMSGKVVEVISNLEAGSKIATDSWNKGLYLLDVNQLQVEKYIKR